MDKERLKEQWLKEERAAHIQGWDFSHIQGYVKRRCVRLE